MLLLFVKEEREQNRGKERESQKEERKKEKEEGEERESGIKRKSPSGGRPEADRQAWGSVRYILVSRAPSCSYAAEPPASNETASTSLSVCVFCFHLRPRRAPRTATRLIVRRQQPTSSFRLHEFGHCARRLLAASADEWIIVRLYCVRAFLLNCRLLTDHPIDLPRVLLLPHSLPT